MPCLPGVPPNCLRWLLVLLLSLLPSCGSIAPAEYSHDIDELLARGRVYAAELSTLAADELTDEQVVSLGYLERMRLGMGSPFRLIEYVLRDPRLPAEGRERLAYAILNLTLSERGYQVDPIVLDLLRIADMPSPVRAGAYHLRLIEATIDNAPTPDVGEHALRIGYALAAAERTIESAPRSPLVHVAALVADRHKARADAADLLRNAAVTQANPLELLVEWRRTLRFQVERPAHVQIEEREETAEARLAPRIAQSLRLLRQRLSAPLSLVRDETLARSGANASWLSPEVALRLDSIAASYDYPPQAPVAVAVMVNRRAFVSRPDLDAHQRDARERFADSTWNEERLVAGGARLRAAGGGGPRLSLIELQSAVFLRAWNQEEPWFPGDAAPASKDLEARFGLAGVSFDREVPEHWRPYYRRALARALTDLQRVLPTSSVRGLTIRIGTLPPEAEALALHDPRARTITLPPATGAGTLAHEVAHDLDWQLARSRYGRRGYATDLALQRGRQDRIASSLHGLAASFVRDPDDESGSPHTNRPTEVFARGTDWFVSALLAREGRTGGYLTSFQDAAITGYGSTRGPDVGGTTVPALITILDHIAPVTTPARRWALDQYGPSRTITSAEMVRAIVSGGAGRPGMERLDSIQDARDRALVGLGEASCGLVSSEDARRVIGARRELIRVAVSAAARGAAIDGVRAVAGELRPELATSTVDRWLAWRLYGAPQPADSVLDELTPALEPILLRAAAVEAIDGVAPGGAFDLQSVVPICGGNPFAEGYPSGGTPRSGATNSTSYEVRSGG
jgi:hypothetical protein